MPCQVSSSIEPYEPGSGPLIVPEDLPVDNPVKAVASEFTKRYEQTFGAGTRNAFAGYSYDGFLLLDAAIPIAMQKAKPVTGQLFSRPRSFFAGRADATLEPRSIVENNFTGRNSLEVETRAVLRAALQEKRPSVSILRRSF